MIFNGKADYATNPGVALLTDAHLRDPVRHMILKLMERWLPQTQVHRAHIHSYMHAHSHAHALAHPTRTYTHMQSTHSMFHYAPTYAYCTIHFHVTSIRIYAQTPFLATNAAAEPGHARATWRSYADCGGYDRTTPGYPCKPRGRADALCVSGQVHSELAERLVFQDDQVIRAHLHMHT